MQRSLLLSFAVALLMASCATNSNESVGESMVHPPPLRDGLEQIAVVRFVTGSATVEVNGKSRVPVAGEKIGEGATLQTGADGRVDLFLAENGPVVEVTAGTKVKIERLRADRSTPETVVETVFSLDAGKILCSVKKMAPNSVFEVNTPKGVASLRSSGSVTAQGKVKTIR